MTTLQLLWPVMRKHTIPDLSFALIFCFHGTAIDPCMTISICHLLQYGKRYHTCPSLDEKGLLLYSRGQLFVATGMTLDIITQLRVTEFAAHNVPLVHVSQAS